MNRLLLAGAALVLLTACGTGTEPGSAVGEPTRPPAASPSATASSSPTASPSPASTPSPTSSPSPPADPVPAGTVIDVSFAGGQAAGDIPRVPVATGEPVTLRITSDVAEEVHVHGVDLYEDVVPGKTTTVEFAAPAPGVYSIELHDSGLVLTRMEVT